MDLSFRPLPEDNQIELYEPILIKTTPECECPGKYHVVIPRNDPFSEQLFFVEISNQQNTYWYRNQIEGYIPLDELDKVPMIDNALEENEEWVFYR